jgi:hypothetical protein
MAHGFTGWSEAWKKKDLKIREKKSEEELV